MFFKTTFYIHLKTHAFLNIGITSFLKNEEEFKVLKKSQQ